MYELFASQGGGTVRWDEVARAWRFVTPPPYGSWISGDLMPDEWGVAGPINADPAWEDEMEYGF